MSEGAAGTGGLAHDGQSTQAPEQRELARLRAELRELHEEVVQREMQAERLRAQLDAFAQEQLLRLGPLIAERDELDARIAEALLKKDPHDPVLGRRAQEARARAQIASDQAVEAGERGPIRRVAATENLKRLYRAAALRVHPDLGRDPKDRQIRTEFMTRLNAAFKHCDEVAIEDLMARWNAVTDPPQETDTGKELVRVIRTIDRLRTAMRRLELDIEQLRMRPEHALMVEAARASAEERDLLAEYAVEINVQIKRRRERLSEISKDDHL